MKYHNFRHSRAGGNPLPDVWQTMFYHSLLCFDVDSRLRGNNDAVFFRSIDDTS